MRRSSVISGWASLESSSVSNNEVNPWTRVAPATTATNGASRSGRCRVMTSSIRNFVMPATPGRQPPDQRQDETKAQKKAARHHSSQIMGHTDFSCAAADFFFFFRSISGAKAYSSATRSPLDYRLEGVSEICWYLPEWLVVGSLGLADYLYQRLAVRLRVAGPSPGLSPSSAANSTFIALAMKSVRDPHAQAAHYGNGSYHAIH